MGHGIQHGFAVHAFRACGTQFRNAQAGGQRRQHAQSRNAEQRCPGEKPGFSAYQRQQRLSHGGDDGVGQQQRQREDGEAAGALPLGNTGNQHGHDAGGVDGKRRALQRAHARDNGGEMRPSGKEGVGQHDAAGEKDGAGQRRQLTASEQSEAGQRTAQQDHDEHAGQQDAAHVGGDADAFQPLLKAVIDGNIAVVAQ